MGVHYEGGERVVGFEMIMREIHMRTNVLLDFVIPEVILEVLRTLNLLPCVSRGRLTL